MSRPTERPRSPGSDGGAFRRVLRRHGLWAVNVLGVGVGVAQVLWGPTPETVSLLGTWAPHVIHAALIASLAGALAGIPSVIRSLGDSGNDWS